MRTRTMPLKEIKLREELHPRGGVTDSTRVRQMVAALRAGDEFPPLLVDRQTLTLVDGWHRRLAYLRFLGEDARVVVQLKTFGDEAAMLLASVEVNARHGVPLEPMDQARVIMIGRDLGIAPGKLAQALGVEEIDLETLTADRIALDSKGRPMLVKRTLAPLVRKRPGMRLTPKQAAVNASLVGMRPEYYLNRTLGLVKERLLDFEDPNIAGPLFELGAAIAVLEKKGTIKKVA